MEYTISRATQIRVASAIQEVECIRDVRCPATFLECLPTSDQPAIRSTDDAEALSYGDLYRFMTEGGGRLWPQGMGRGDVVGIVIPIGPEMAVALLCCLCQCTAAPLDPALREGDFEAALLQLNIHHAIALQRDATQARALEAAASKTRCKVLRVVKSSSKVGLFEWAVAVADVPASPSWLGGLDTALVLRTSGTTSKPKVVPLTAQGLFTGAMCIGRGLDLAPTDVCLNVMPCTHIGGISCSLLSTLFTGGSVVCASAFDPIRFVKWLVELRPTWYYAAPTIHKAVTIYAKSLSRPIQHCLRFIRSGAANLSDADAREMRELFGCSILPTYSMSECMPVAQPPLGYNLEKPGTVGVPIGSSMRIVGATGKTLPFGQDGEVCIRGPVVTRGYVGNDVANAESFFGDVDADGCRWFRTGDVGHLEARTGFLFLTGRSKELIKRGGEQVSPYEVEEALLACEAVQIAVVFGVPNEFWGEEVAAAVVLKPGFVAAQRDGCELAPAASPSAANAGARSVSLADLTAALAASTAPRQIRFLDSEDLLPKTPTGKYIRKGLAAHLGMQAVDLAAATGLQAAGAGQAAELPRVKVGRGIYGLRFVCSLWVIYIHTGNFTQGTWGTPLMAMSGTMPCFFLLAGFLLAAGTTSRITNKLDFYRNRIIAAHPMYLMSVVVALPYTFIMCAPDGTKRYAAGEKCWLDDDFLLGGAYWSHILYIVTMAVFAQLAWPWGVCYIHLYGNLPHWFSSAYYFSILCFPFFYDAMNARSLLCGRDPRKYVWRPLCIRYLCWQTLGLSALFAGLSISLWLVMGELGDVIAWHSYTNYTFPVAWALIFFVGMLTFKVFELNRRDPGCYVWPYWGWATDLLSVGLVISLLLGPILELYAEPAHRRNVKNTWKYPGKMQTGYLAVYIYGIAVGEGFTAKLLSNNFLVKYLSPASYCMYLFHSPVDFYMGMLVGAARRQLPDSVVYFVSHFQYFVVVLLTLPVALVVTHKLNAPATAAFMRFVDWLFSRWCSKGRPQDGATLSVVVSSIKALTGADVDASIAIATCGLDSFGTSALLGILKPRFPGIKITSMEMYSLETVGDLVSRIDRDLGVKCDLDPELALAGRRDVGHMK